MSGPRFLESSELLALRRPVESMKKLTKRERQTLISAMAFYEAEVEEQRSMDYVSGRWAAQELKAINRILGKCGS